MKFTDGYWQALPGVTILRPRGVDEISASEDELTIFAATAPITGRGDTLNRPVVTITLDAPAEDVIGVRIEHFQGVQERGPAFELNRTHPVVQIDVPADGGAATFSSGQLTATVAASGEWSLDFTAEGRTLTSSTSRGVGVITDAAGRHFVREQLGLGVGEHVYGLGERFGALVKNGQSIDIWNADGGTASEQAYKNIPFYLTDAGYGVFVAHPERVSFEVGSEVVSRSQFSVEGQRLQYYVIYGPTPKEILTKYTALTGRPAQVPDWSYGLWLSTSFTTSYDEATVGSFIDGMAERGIPLSVFHFDCFWMRQFYLCDLVWDPDLFPEPAAMLARLKAKGVHISAWINPYIAQRSELFREGKQHGYLLKTESGDVWQWDMWQAGMALVDFTNPEACGWFAGKLKVLLDQGVDTFKTDFGERVPTEGVRWHDGSDPELMHNYYAQRYNRCVHDLLRQERGDGDAVVFARSATAGGQQFPVHWGGDCESTFVSMAESLRGGLSLALSGFGFWSHDIGGFEGTPDPAVFKRWVAFGLLSSHSRLHGSGSYRVPWVFDEEAVDVTRDFTRLKMSLMPYLSGLGRIAHTEGVPVMRPMVMEFPDDRGAVTVETQYMLGDQLLVAPVFSEDGTVDFYLPEGIWTHLLSGEKLAGPRWHRDTYGFDSLPLFVRPGSVIPRGSRSDRPDYDHADGVTLGIFEFADGDERTVAVGEATFTVRRDGDQLSVDAVGTDKPWRVRVGDQLVDAESDRVVLRP
ncbi:alpha-xylosidase [Microlunatus panaciterrae]|uniref:Alpha-D-xyloside xylohydrolase n=1 Tax=Microlunatus panaciterrae TaxID=400768 RepID=A0ABS2RJI5_9ACTN|nr:alpha-xylosidase [Microlunatus panaciterrae]MBM7798124.1 alpha-D-xyloside xylohydrolase [Microlunatus panaciterrae]